MMPFLCHASCRRSPKWTGARRLRRAGAGARLADLAVKKRAAVNLHADVVGGGWRPHVLRGELARSLAGALQPKSIRSSRAPNPLTCPLRSPPSSTSSSTSRPPGPHDPAVAAAAGGSGYQV